MLAKLLLVNNIGLFLLLLICSSYSDFQAYTRVKKNKTYICKPESGCQGRGIFLSKSSKDIQPGEHMICQVYISKVRYAQPFQVKIYFYAFVILWIYTLE